MGSERESRACVIDTLLLIDLFNASKYFSVSLVTIKSFCIVMFLLPLLVYHLNKEGANSFFSLGKGW